MISLFWLLLSCVLFLFILTIYFFFYYQENPTYKMPSGIPKVKKSTLNPLSRKLRRQKNKEFRDFLLEEETIRLDLSFAVEVFSHARYTGFSDIFVETKPSTGFNRNHNTHSPTTATQQLRPLHRTTISSLSHNLALNLPFPHKFACSELYISRKRNFIGFFSTFDQKIFGVRLNEVVRIRNFFPETDRISIECWIEKSLVRFQIDIQKGSDVFYKTLVSEEAGLNHLVDVAQRKPVLVVYNPQSGIKRSQEIFKHAKTLYNYVGLPFEACCTKYAGHARDYMKNVLQEGSNELRYDTILAIGGDGTLTEIFNGLRLVDESLLKRVAVVPVPAGSGNGVAETLFSCGNDYMIPIRCVLHNQRKKMDGIIMTFGDGSSSIASPSESDGAAAMNGSNSILSILTLTVGIVADADHESEVIRFLGDLRFVIFSVYLTLRYMRAYSLRITMSVDENFQPVKDNNIEIAEGQTEVTFENDYYCFMVGNATHITKDLVAFDVAQTDDGYMDLFLIPKTYNLWALIRTFVAMLAGCVSSESIVQYFKTKHLVIEPILGRCPTDLMMIDGEARKMERVECQVDSGGCLTVGVV